MVSWPVLGTRVTVRYRRPAGSVPPLTDAVGHLLAVDPVVRVRTKTGAVVEFAPADVVALRALTDAPVRTSQIRALEHAAAAAWPGDEHAWLHGWLLRAGQGAGLAANSAMPLDISAQVSWIPAISKIIAWYDRRGLTPRLAIPERLLPLSPGVTGERTDRVLVRDVSDASGPDPSITLSARPDDAWLRIYGREVPVDALTAVIDGELTFGTHPRGAATLPATRTASELRPRLFVQTLDGPGRALLHDDATTAGSLGMPADAHRAITVGAADAQGRPRPYSAAGPPHNLELLRKPDVLAFDEAGGTGQAACFAAGLAAATRGAGAPLWAWLESLQVRPGGVLRIPPGWPRR